MKRQNTALWRHAIEDRSVVSDGSNTDFGSDAWRQKMAMLDEIHEQISPQVLAMRMALEDIIEPEDFLDRDELNPARLMTA